MSIVTLAAFKDYVRDEAQGINDSILQGYLDAASAALNNACGRQWVVAGAVATARLFDAPWNDSLLVINDCTTVTAVADYGTSLTVSTQYQLYPLNGLSATGEAVPYNAIQRMASGYYTYWLNYGKPGQVSVTATWGWPAIPYQIVEACKVLGKELCNNQDVRFGIVAAGDAVVSGIRQNKVVREAINAYPHPNSIGVA